MCLAAAVIGYLFRPATWLERAVLLAAALLLIDPGLVTDLIGLAVLGLGAALQRFRPAGRAVAAADAKP
jgi:TRAP-type uncharacterized transport system fused permease subunit